MTSARHLLAAALCLLSLEAAAQTPTGLTVSAGATTREVTEAELMALPQDTVRARAHGGPAQRFVGPRLDAVLGLAGARLDSLRGKAMAQYVVIEARDGYRAVFAVAELSRDFVSGRVILARKADGQVFDDRDGPWRVIAEGDLRPARWVRQVSAIRLK